MRVKKWGGQVVLFAPLPLKKVGGATAPLPPGSAVYASDSDFGPDKSKST